MLPYTDNFNRANETPIGGNWTPFNNGGSLINLSGNQVVSNNYTWTAFAFRNSETYLANQYSQVKIASAVGANYVGGPTVRSSCDATKAAWWNGYTASVASSSVIQIYANYGTGMTAEQIGTDIAGTFAQGDIIGLGIMGSVLCVYQNGALLATRTDTNNRITSGGAPGFEVENAAGSPALDDWMGQNFPFITPVVGAVNASGVSSRNDRGIFTPTEVNL